MSAVAAVGAAIYSLASGGAAPHAAPASAAPAPSGTTSGTIPRIQVGPPAPSVSTFAKTSPSGSTPPARVSPTPARTSAPPRKATPPPSSPPSRPPRAPVPPASSPPGLLTGDARITHVLAFLSAQVGKPYLYGGIGPNSYDCSGLIVAAFQTIGVPMPRVASDQAHVGTPVSLSSLQPGDILFWGVPATHSAVYVGGGIFIGAQNPGVGVARVLMTYDPPQYARRVI